MTPAPRDTDGDRMRSRPGVFRRARRAVTGRSRPHGLQRVLGQHDAVDDRRERLRRVRPQRRILGTGGVARLVGVREPFAHQPLHAMHLSSRDEVRGPDGAQPVGLFELHTDTSWIDRVRDSGRDVDDRVGTMLRHHPQHRVLVQHIDVGCGGTWRPTRPVEA